MNRYAAYVDDDEEEMVDDLVIPVEAELVEEEPPQPQGVLIAHCGAGRISRQELALVRTPEATRTHQPVPHHKIAEALIECLGFRHISVVREEYAVTPDGNRMFGVLDLNYDFNGCRFSIGLRNSHDKSLRLAVTIGYRVFICDNLAFRGDFSPLLAKHSRNFDLLDGLSVAVDKMQRNFDGIKSHVLDLQRTSVGDNDARLIIYEAFVEGKLKLPTQLIPHVHKAYFKPEHEEFKGKTLWSLSNAMTGVFKAQLKPINEMRAAAKIGAFMERYIPPF